MEGSRGHSFVTFPHQHSHPHPTQKNYFSMLDKVLFYFFPIHRPAIRIQISSQPLEDLRLRQPERLNDLNKNKRRIHKMEILSTERAFEVTKEMLCARNWTITNIDESKKEIYATTENNESVVAIFFEVTKGIKEFIEQSLRNQQTFIVVICKGTISSNLKKIESLSDHVELFSESDLQFDISTHELQPRCSKLSEAEAKNFKSRYMNNRFLRRPFPIIQQSDKLARFLRFRKGDIVKIEDDGFIGFRVVS
jgi:DNA-directed RNA polymerase subunit H (RpoH/RPB5)